MMMTDVRQVVSSKYFCRNKEDAAAKKGGIKCSQEVQSALSNATKVVAKKKRDKNYHHLQTRLSHLVIM